MTTTQEYGSGGLTRRKPNTRNLALCILARRLLISQRNWLLESRVTVYLEEHRTRGYYGRLLAYIQLPDGRFLNEVLLTEGFAYADLRFRHSFYNKYKQLEASARSEKRGLWQKVTRDQLPQWLQKRRPNLLRGK